MAKDEGMKHIHNDTEYSDSRKGLLKKVLSLLIKFQTWPLSAVRVYILLIINFIN